MSRLWRTHGRTDEQWKVEQYSVLAESTTSHFQKNGTLTPPNPKIFIGGVHNVPPPWSLDTLKWADPNRVKRELLHLLTILTCQGKISELLVLSQVYKCWTGIFFEEVPCKHTFSSDIFCDQEQVRNINLSSRYKLSIFTFIVTNMNYQLR